MEDEKKIKRIEQLNTLLNEVESGGVTLEEVGELFNVLAEVMRQIKAEVDNRLAQVGPEMERRLGNMASYVGNFENQIKEAGNLSKKGEASLLALADEMRAELERIENLIPEETNLKPLEEKIKTVMDYCREAMKDEKLIEKINLAKGKIKKEKIEGLDELIKPATGGVTNARIQQAFKYILKTEQPTGSINGSNTAYTVTQPIFAVLSFSLNGETIAQLPNYTINGKTITFSTALPAAYSGKDFEIKYI